MNALALLYVLSPLSGGISQEALMEPERDAPWVHNRTRFFLMQKSEDRQLRRSQALWGYEASGYFQYDSEEDGADKREGRIENLFLRAYRGAWNLRVGWQTVSWGETLGPGLVDLINPRDLRDPSYWLRGDHKLAVPLLLLGWNRENTSIEAWFNPMAPQSLLPDSWQGFSIDTKGQTQGSEFGVRAGQRIQGWDLKVYALRHRARTPAMTLDIRDPAPAINATFPVQTSLGLTLSQAWDHIVLRSEYVHAESSELPAQNLLDFARDQLVVGMDGSWGDHFFWGTELRYNHQKSPLPEDEDLGWVIAQGRWSLWNDRLKPLIHLMQRVDQHDAYQRYEVTGNVKNSWTLGLAWEAFQSAKKGYFTRLAAYDRLGVTIQWEF